MSKVQTSDFEQQDYAVGRHYLSMQHWDGDTRRGIFRHPSGLAEVYESRGAKWIKTSIHFIHDGRHYSRWWDANWGERTLARLAREMVEKIVA